MFEGFVKVDAVGRLKVGCSQDWLPPTCFCGGGESGRTRAAAREGRKLCLFEGFFKLGAVGRLKVGCSQDWLPHIVLGLLLLYIVEPTLLDFLDADVAEHGD